MKEFITMIGRHFYTNNYIVDSEIADLLVKYYEVNDNHTLTNRIKIEQVLISNATLIDKVWLQAEEECLPYSHNENESSSILNEIKQYIQKENQMKKDFKVGDRVKVIADNELKGKTGELRHINNHSAIVKFDDTTIDNTTILFRNLEKIEGKQKKEPFELKEGMKVVSIDKEIYIFNGDEYVIDGFGTEMIGVIKTKVGLHTTVGIPKSRIDWEETRKLNTNQSNITINLNLDKQQELITRTNNTLKALNSYIEAINADKIFSKLIKINVEVTNENI